MSFSSEDRYKELFRHIVEAHDHIKVYVDGFNISEFLVDQKTQDAVCMRLQQALESAGKLSEKAKANLKIDWPSLIAMRHKLSHHYVDVDPKMVWEVVIEFEEFQKLTQWARKKL